MEAMMVAIGHDVTSCVCVCVFFFGVCGESTKNKEESKMWMYPRSFKCAAC